MRQLLLAITLQLVAFLAFAQGSLPLYEYVEENDKPWFSNSLKTGNQTFDSWTISSGYHYPVHKKVNVFLATELTTDSVISSGAKGVASGVQFNVNETLTFDSSIQAERINEETIGVFGMSSTYRITDSLNLEAKVDYNFNQMPENSTNYQLGVGYRF
ncbi:hypothetical protein [Enterovibrio nigricans]|uniref:Outer membrane insertion C-terminal signal n=1 Tax=Enterovibrio nigricans DSM 22720 TaxID=1121868 RepID=A0A1T4TTE3_9GAMM|nr:hypothetical protein [Enterovibrio nigricans]PKF51927.1 hypothetical protein AT251_00550 [Enterovibrio nigricans]SKA43707.1 outer membrane insertion C-terminal signal [Enterovibrio nigricans DSM 22720]